MRFAYLGLFARIFEWIFEKILSPIVKFLASLLSAVFEWIFENIIAPILTLVLKEIIPWIIDLIKELLSFLFYEILAYLCKIINYMQEAFDIFAGVQQVTYEIDGEKSTGPLLQAVMAQPAVFKLFIAIMAVGFFMAMVFTIIQVGKSVIDLDFDGKRPVGAVLRSLFKTAIQFIMVPLSVIIIISFSTLLLKTIDDAVVYATGTSGKAKLGNIVFCIASLEAEKTPGYNIGSYKPTDGKSILEVGGRGPIYADTESFLDSTYVQKHFKLGDFDYFTGYIAGIFLIIILAATGLVFIQRLFDIIVLYVISPIFISTMPLDEGEKFKRWKDLFYGKVFGGYGAILSMQVYFLLIPFIMGPQITWGGPGTSEDSVYLFKLLFLLGGAYATTKMGPMITGLISQSAGAAEAQTSGMVSSYMGGKAIAWTTAGISAVAGGVGSLIGGGVSGLTGSGKERTDIADAKFDKMRPQKPGEGGDKADDKKKSEGNKADPPKKKADLKYDTEGGKAKEKSGFDKFLGGVHKVLPHKSNPDGSYSFGLLGFRINYDKDGNRTGFKIPCMEFKYDKKGKSHVDSFKVPGVVKMQRQGKDGSFCVKDIPAIGLNRTQGQDGEFHTSHLGLVGYNAEEMDNGQFNKTSIMGIKFGAKLNEKTGNYETNGVRVGNFIFGGESLEKK